MCIIWWALCEGIICCALSHKFAKCNFEAQSIHETPSPISAEAASWCICAQCNPANYLYAAHIACSMVHIAYCTLLHLHAVRSIWWMQTMHNNAQFGYFAIYSIVPCEIALWPIVYQTLHIHWHSPKNPPNDFICWYKKSFGYFFLSLSVHSESFVQRQCRLYWSINFNLVFWVQLSQCTSISVYLGICICFCVCVCFCIFLVFSCVGIKSYMQSLLL